MDTLTNEKRDKDESNLTQYGEMLLTGLSTDHELSGFPCTAFCKHTHTNKQIAFKIKHHNKLEREENQTTFGKSCAFRKIPDPILRACGYNL